MRSARLIFVLLAAAGLGCSEQFDPKGEFEPRLVLYSVLSTRSDTCFVRVHATYDPPGFDPLEVRSEPSLTGAVAVLSEGRTDRPMTDMLVPHPDAVRYGGSMKIFILTPFRPKRGTEYSIRVNVPGYPDAIGTTVIPETSDIFLTNSTLLGLASNSTESMSAIISTPPTVKGFLVQLYVEYLVLNEGGALRRTEIASRLGSSPQGAVPVYPTLSPTARYAGRDFDPVTLFDFDIEAWKYSVDAIYARYGYTNVVFQRAKVYLYLVDHHLYNYSNIANGFRDQFSVRTDIPDYTNVQGGVGVVGSYTIDSLAIVIPSKPQ